MTYAIVTSEKVDAYIESRGQIGRAIETFATVSAAREHAAEIANDYHYGVEIVDTDTWQTV